MKSEIFKTAFSKISFLTVIMASVIAVPFVLGKYCELNTPGAFDSGAYVYSAEHIIRGAKIGVDEVPTAKISTLLVNILGVKIFGYSDVGPKIIQGLMQLAALVLIFMGVKKHFGRAAAFISTLLTSIYISAPFIAKYGNVKEEFMTACIGISIGSFFLYYGGGRKIWAVICGAALAFAPGFKETGFSMTLAMASFLFVSVIFKWKPFKEVLKDGVLVFIGMLVTLAPLHIWLAAGDVPMSGPYTFLKRYAVKPFKSSPKQEKSSDNKQADGSKEAKSESKGGYLERSRSLMGIKEQTPVVLRYYKALLLPILLALLSLIIAKYRNTCDIFGKKKKYDISVADRLVFLPAVCWIFDMLFVWISPRSYEQYYIPLTLSASVTGGYIVWLYAKNAAASKNNKMFYAGGGMVAVIFMILMSWDVFAGFDHTFHSGDKYPDGKRVKGYSQRLKEASAHSAGNLASWEKVSEFIKRSSSEDDTMYVWGWFPGMYVEAQRLSPYKKAFESEMHVKSPKQIAGLMRDLLKSFKEEKPLFIVDSRKRHFPWDRPQLELWPSTPKGFLPENEMIVAQYEKQYYNMLAEKIGKDEADRFAAMAELRKYIRENYYIVDEKSYQFSSRGLFHPKIGTHVIFKRKN
ncbi:MAG: ArnT family glycosyltransferase [Sedimentisphaeraceae bacterium JB056]